MGRRPAFETLCDQSVTKNVANSERDGPKADEIDVGEAWGWCLSWSSKPVGLRKETGRFDSYLLPPLAAQQRHEQDVHPLSIVIHESAQ